MDTVVTIIDDSKGCELIQQRSVSPEVHADFDAVGDGNRCDFFDLCWGAFQINVSLINSHFPVIPGFGSLTARSPSAADS